MATDPVTSRFEYEENATCGICDSRRPDTLRRVKKEFPWGSAFFVRCDSCGTWYQSPQITLGSLGKWLDSPDYQGSGSKSGVAYVNYIDDEPSRLEEAYTRYRRDLARDLPKGSRVLEIGCSTGSLLSVIQANGCSVVGTDLSPKFAEAAKRLHGVDVLLGDLGDLNLPARSFDMIVLFGTIGNLRNTSRYFQSFRQLLKDTGILVFSFVDADSPVVRYFYRSRFWMFTPSVSCFITQRGCKLALARNGFRVLEMRSDRQRPSLRKFLKLAGMDFLIPVMQQLGLDVASLPFALPIPSVRFVRAAPVRD